MKTVLFEYDSSLPAPYLLNHSAGVWKCTLTPAITNVVDDDGDTGTFVYENDTVYNVQSLLVDNVQYSEATSLADCIATDGSFYYDSDTTVIYIAFTDYETPDGKTVLVGVSSGYSLYSPDNNYPIWDGREYQPRIEKLFPLKKNIDRAFFGRLEYQKADLSFLNHDGHFDDWRDRNVYGNRARVLYGSEDADYDDLTTIYEGNVSDDERTWSDFSLQISDQREALTQPVCTRFLTADDYPNMNTDYIGEVVPVHGGKIYEGKCYPLDEGTAPSSTYEFIFTDTTKFSVSSLDAVYVNGGAVTPDSTNLSEGTFKLEDTDVEDEWANVTATFTMSNTNGIDIITDLIDVYDGRTYTASFWDLTETNAAQSDARNTSFIADDSDVKLNEIIESVMFDIGGRFFVKNNGLFTVRLYDAERDVDHVIERDELFGEPKIKNNGSEFLSSCTIKYQKNQRTDEWKKYNETSYEDDVFSRYKRKKSDDYETGLYEESAAQAKAEEIMDISANIADEIEWTVSWGHYDIEITDFVAVDATGRYGETEDKKVYEALSVSKDIEKEEVKLLLRYVRDYIVATYEYDVLVDESGDVFNDESGNTLIGSRVV